MAQRCSPGALSAGHSRRAQPSGLHSRPPPPLSPLLKAGGSYPLRSVAAAETPRRAWTLGASMGG